ncbi:hypothetical protein A1F95_10444, partial [Pyrenophora tritici-repentis]
MRQHQNPPGYKPNQIGGHNATEGLHKKRKTLDEGDQDGNKSEESEVHTDKRARLLETPQLDRAVNDTNVLAAVAQYIGDFPTQAQKALNGTLNYLENVLSKSFNETKSDRIFSLRAKEYKRILENRQDVHPISASDYCNGDSKFREGTIIICTSKQARQLLETCTLSVPLIVPQQFNNALQPRTLLTIDQFRQQLQFRKPIRGKAWIDVQDFSNEEITQKRELDGALQHMDNPELGPINFLNIRTLRENVVPWELQGLADYRVLQEASDCAGVANDNQQGLNFPDSFALWGKQGTWSFPHVDKHGLYTAVLCEQGEKLWFSWSLDDNGLKEWAVARDETYGPKPSGFPILLRSGDLLIQPPGTVHTPASVTNVIMTGYFFWCSRTMNTTARCALLDLKHPNITNEEVQPELGGKLKHLVRASKLKLRPYDWGKQEDLVKFHNLAKLQLQTVVDLLHHLRPASGKEGKDVVADINVIGAGSVLDLQLDRVEAVEYLALEDGYAGLLFERMYLRVVAVNEF